MLSQQWSSLCAGIKPINYALHIHFRFPPRRLTPASLRFPLPPPRAGTELGAKGHLWTSGSRTTLYREHWRRDHQQSINTFFATLPHHRLSTTWLVNDICSYWFVLQTTRRLIIKEYKQCTLILRSENKAKLRLADELGLISLIQQCLVPRTGNSNSFNSVISDPSALRLTVTSVCFIIL